jgi:hypothetical protein
MNIKVKKATHSLKSKSDDEKNEELENKKKNLVIPQYQDASSLLDKRVYSLSELKEICRHYKLKVTGNKTELYESILTVFRHIKSAYIIQTSWKKYSAKIYNRMRGPARFNRSCCVNESDFFSMDSLKEIPYTQFFSYKDSDNMVYGFDLLSLFLLFEKGSNSNVNVTNPYNRQPFPDNIRTTMNRLVVFSKMFGEHINIKNEDRLADYGGETGKSIEELIVELFNEIDSLGNYTNSAWFLVLASQQLIRFIQNLLDIWVYRANLCQQVRIEIFPPSGDPFRDIHVYNLNNSTNDQLRHTAYTLMRRFVQTGINRDSRCLGTNYVLCALTLVSPAAANALPWLYQSVSL